MSDRESNTAVTVPTTWFPVPDPDDDPDRSPFINWRRMPVGFELIGIWRGAMPGGDFGPYPYGVVEDVHGAHLRFGLRKILARRLEAVEIGVTIRIVYLGTRPGKEGRSPYHVFDVFSDRPVTRPGARAEIEAHADDDEVPF